MERIIHLYTLSCWTALMSNHKTAASQKGSSMPRWCGAAGDRTADARLVPCSLEEEWRVLFLLSFHRQSSLWAVVRVCTLIPATVWYISVPPFGCQSVIFPRWIKGWHIWWDERRPASDCLTESHAPWEIQCNCGSSGTGVPTISMQFAGCFSGESFLQWCMGVPWCVAKPTTATFKLRPWRLNQTQPNRRKRAPAVACGFVAAENAAIIDATA